VARDPRALIRPNDIAQSYGVAGWLPRCSGADDHDAAAAVAAEALGVERDKVKLTPVLMVDAGGLRLHLRSPSHIEAAGADPGSPEPFWRVELVHEAEAT
jgi:hypothetical protein